MPKLKKNNDSYRELRVPGMGIILAPRDMTAEQLLKELDTADQTVPTKKKTKKKS